jgi:DNA polymerase III sliding clamp (beta) subunit (PCNA family)
LILEATNGYTLARVTLEKKSYLDFNTLIPISSLKHVKNFLDTTIYPTITLAKGHILFKDVSQFVAVRLIQEDFPDTRSIIPKEYENSPIVYELNATLKQCLKQVAKVQTDKDVSHIMLSVDKQNNFLIVGSDTSGHDLYEYADDDFVEEGCASSKFSTAYFGHAIAHTTKAYQSGVLTPLVCEDDNKKILILVMARRSN